MMIGGNHTATTSAETAQAVRALGYKDQDDWYQSPLRDLSRVISLAYESGETGVARGLSRRRRGAAWRRRACSDGGCLKHAIETSERRPRTTM